MALTITNDAINGTVSDSEGNLEWSIKLGINVLIAFVSITGNVLVLLLLNRTKAKGKTPFDYFVGNLSIADLIFEIGFLTAAYVKSESLLFCKTIYPIQSICLVVSMYTVVAIAIFRYKTTTKPLHFRPGKNTIYGTIVTIWLLSHVIFIPLYLVIKHGRKGENCQEDWPSQMQIMNKVYTVVLFATQYLFPLSVIGFCYLKIVFHLRKHTFPNDCSANQLQFVRRRKQTMEVIRITAIILVLYTITTLPLQIAWLSDTVFQEKSLGQVVFLFSDQLVQLHCCCNPVVYGVVSKKFRSKMTNYICEISCCCRRKIYSMKKTKRQLDRERVEMPEFRILSRNNSI